MTRQERIEEAAKKHSCYDEDCEGAFYEPIVRHAFIEGADFALKNQWISVEEALPEEDMPNCFVAYKAMDYTLYSTGSYEKDNKEWYVDGVGFNAEVTHYMPILSLEGGEE